MHSIFSPSRKRRALRLLAVVPVALAAALAYQRLSSKPLSTQAPPPAVPVSVQAVEQRDLPIWLDGIGTVQPLNTVTVRTRVDGELTQVPFTEGRIVHAGELLAQVDPRPYQAQLDAARARQAQDEAKLQSTKVDLERASDLATAGAGPTQTVDTLKAQLATAIATVQADQAAVQSARLQLDFTRIVSPLDGRTGQRLAPAGSIAHTTDAGGIVVVTQMNPISVAFSLPQDQLPEVLQQTVKQPLKVVAMVRDRTREIGQGQLTFIDSQISPANGEIQLKANFDNSQRQLWPGELVAVRVLLRTEHGAITVPSTAVQQGPKGSFVYVVKPDQSVEARAVEAGAAFGDTQWIRSGLAANETVITQGQYRLAPGVKVAVAYPPVPAAQSTTAANPLAQVTNTTAAANPNLPVAGAAAAASGAQR